VGRHVIVLGDVILIPSQPAFALTPYCCMLCREAANTNFLVFGLTRLVLEHAHHHTTDELRLN